MASSDDPDPAAAPGQLPRHPLRTGIQTRVNVTGLTLAVRGPRARVQCVRYPPIRSDQP
jgi:hypothetical protein